MNRIGISGECDIDDPGMGVKPEGDFFLLLHEVFEKFIHAGLGKADGAEHHGKGTGEARETAFQMGEDTFFKHHLQLLRHPGEHHQDFFSFFNQETRGTSKGIRNRFCPLGKKGLPFIDPRHRKASFPEGPFDFFRKARGENQFLAERFGHRLTGDIIIRGAEPS